MVNILGLTSVQQTRLEELVKKLFPNITIEQSAFPGYIPLREGDQLFMIHWFELCMTSLADKILYHGDEKLHVCQSDHKELLMEVMKIYYNEEGEHPVDWLYERFKATDEYCER